MTDHRHDPTHGHPHDHPHDHPHEHFAKDVTTAACRVIVVSDSRTLDTDTGGKTVAELLLAAGHGVAERVVVRDEVAEIRAAVEAAVAAKNDVVILTGGTGITPRDVTPEAVRPLLSRELPGFGEAFRRLSQEEIGVHGLLSRALAGLSGDTLVFALPGSRRACVSALEALILPLLPHALGLRR